MYDGASGSGGEERKANLRLHKNDDRKIVGGVKVFLLAVLAWQPLEIFIHARSAAHGPC